jgi:hypothetical protein
MTEATTKQREYLNALAGKDRRTSEALDFVAADLGLDHWYEAPMSKRLASALISIFKGEAGSGLFVWAVKQDREIAA